MMALVTGIVLNWKGLIEMACARHGQFFFCHFFPFGGRSIALLRIGKANNMSLDKPTHRKESVQHSAHL
jgi:hypothetical protein